MVTTKAQLLGELLVEAQTHIIGVCLVTHKLQGAGEGEGEDTAVLVELQTHNVPRGHSFIQTCAWGEGHAMVCRVCIIECEQ